MSRQVLTYPDLPAVLTPTAGDLKYLPLTGGTLTGPLFVGGTANAAYAVRATGGTVSARLGQVVPGGRLDLTQNAWYDGSQWLRDDVSKSAAAVSMRDDTPFVLTYAPAGANPIAWGTTPQLAWSSVGTLTVTPNAGQPAIVAKGAIVGPVSDQTGWMYALDASSAGGGGAGFNINQGQHLPPFADAPGGLFSGMFLLNDTSSGLISLWMTGGGQLFKIGGATQHVQSSAPSGGQMGVYMGGTSNLNVVIASNVPGSSNLRVMAFRSRSNA